MVSRAILNGAIDIHVHAGPSVANRQLDAADMLVEAETAGYKAFVVKDHYFPTMMGAKMVEEKLGKGITKCFGGIALNSSVGGLNLNALDSAHSMGAKVVWMPTVSTVNHIDSHKGSHFAGSGKGGVPEKPIIFVDSDYHLTDEAVEVLKYVADTDDMILSTGHGNPREINAIVEAAVKLGITKLVVNHPYVVIRAGYEDSKRWAEMGAYIELCACALAPSSIFYGKMHFSDDEVKAYLDRALSEIGPRRMILDSDFGQSGNGSPVDGLFNLVETLMTRFGATEQDINLMLKENPAGMLGL